MLNRQLRTLWETEPYLSTAKHTVRDQPDTPRPLLRDHLRGQYQRLGYEFVPLVTEQLRLYCALDILFLRPQAPGRALQSGDIDNRLKTLFDALRMPDSKEELGGYDQPGEDETPFHCLMTDDKLITKIAVETDRLLEPTSPDREHNDNDSRLIITVRLKPYDLNWDNLNFA